MPFELRFQRRCGRGKMQSRLEGEATSPTHGLFNEIWLLVDLYRIFRGRGSGKCREKGMPLSAPAPCLRASAEQLWTGGPRRFRACTPKDAQMLRADRHESYALAVSWFPYSPPPTAVAIRI